jgi:hypothetical protein
VVPVPVNDSVACFWLLARKPTGEGFEPTSEKAQRRQLCLSPLPSHIFFGCLAPCYNLNKNGVTTISFYNILRRSWYRFWSASYVYGQSNRSALRFAVRTLPCVTRRQILFYIFKIVQVRFAVFYKGPEHRVLHQECTACVLFIRQKLGTPRKSSGES